MARGAARVVAGARRGAVVAAGERLGEREARSFLVAAPQLTLSGVELGAWTIDRPLGTGGMGSVWLARRTDGRFEGLAAVKLLNLALVSSRGQARFRREGSVLARLTHPGIARLLDAGVTAGGQPYLVLEYVDGVPSTNTSRKHASLADDADPALPAGARRRRQRARESDRAPRSQAVEHSGDARRQR